MNNIKDIVEKIKNFPKIKSSSQRSLFDLIKPESSLNKELSLDKSFGDSAIKFINVIKKSYKESDYLLLSWDLETTGLIRGWEKDPKVLLCSFALFSLKGKETDLFYKFDSININDIFVTSSLKEIEEIFNVCFTIKNLITVGWNISGYDHIVLEKSISKDFSNKLTKLVHEKRTYDGYILFSLLSIAINGDLNRKFGLNVASQYYLGETLDKTIRKEFFDMTYDSIKESHIEYSLKDSIIAGFVFFKIVQQCNTVESEIMLQLKLLESLNLAKKSGFLTHTTQYLSNYAFTKIDYNGHEVDLKKIYTLAKDLEEKIDNFAECLDTLELNLAIKEDETIDVFSNSKIAKAIKSKLYKTVVKLKSRYTYKFVKDLKNISTYKNEMLKYVAKKYFNMNLITDKESKTFKETGIDVYSEKDRAISPAELSKIKDSPNLQGDYWLLKFGIKSFDELLYKDTILYLWFKLVKSMDQLAFIESYIPHYAKINNKYNLSLELPDKVVKKKENLRIDGLFSCWGIDLTKESTARLYPSFRTLLVSGRTGCSLPNIQQVEKDDIIRSIFVAEPDKILITSDYCSVEMVSEAQIYLLRYGHSKIAKLLNKGIDIHYYTGILFRFPNKRNEYVKILEDKDLSNISLNNGSLEQSYKKIEDKYGVVLNKIESGSDAVKDILTIIFSKVTGLSKKEIKDIRQAAKPINFGVPGGMKPNKIRHIAEVEYGINMTEEESEKFFIFFLKLYPEIKQWLLDSKNYIKMVNDPFFKKKYISGCVTPTGRLRFINESNEGHNEWHNTQFQGLTADAAKLAAYRINEQPGIKVVNFIHDEIVSEVKIEEQDEKKILIKKIMMDTMQEFTKDLRIDVAQGVYTCWKK